MNLFNQIIHWGVIPGQDADLSAKIRLCNIVTLLIFIMAISYTILSYYFIPPVFIIFAACLPISPTTLILNRIGLHEVGRMLISIATPVSVFLGHISIIHQGDEPMNGIIIGSVGFWILPWLLFDYKEKLYLILSSITAVLSILLVPFANTWIEVEFDNALISGQVFQLIFSVTGIIFFYVSMVVLYGFMADSKSRNHSLIQEMKGRERDMERSELELKATLKEMKKVQEEESKRKWIAEGLASLSELVRAQQDLKALGNALMSHLVNYVEANQGGLFIFDEDKNVLELVAFYAYERRKFIRKEIQPGEGLLGQSFLDGETLYFNHIPNDYIRIGSGLGDAKPSGLLILPLKNENQMEGVIEIATFKEFPPHYQEFMDKAGRMLAIHIRSNKSNLLMAKLLKSSQTRALELKEQEAELRRSLFELQSNQKAQKHLQEALDNKIKELEKAKEDIEKVKMEERKKFKEQIAFYQQKLASVQIQKDNVSENTNESAPV
ncbi:MAG: GAF domain-containing protein [Microscillaceae bacterium]|nr:GAF domain-containing protein [Microscillaceae bacterium]